MQEVFQTSYIDCLNIKRDNIRFSKSKSGQACSHWPDSFFRETPVKCPFPIDISSAAHYNIIR